MRMLNKFSCIVRARVAMLCLLFCFLFTAAQAQSNYYWSNNQQIALQEDRSSIIIQLNEGYQPDEMLQGNLSSDIKDVERHAIQRRILIQFNNAKNEDALSVAKGLGVSESAIQSVSFAMQLNDGFQVWRTNRVVLGMYKGQSLQNITGLLREYNASIVENQYNRLVLEVENVENVLELSNQLYQNNAVAWAHPDFYAKLVHNLTPSDPYYSNQFQMNNSNDIDCDAPEAWDITRGSSNIRVAVIDDGVDPHEDLPNLNTSLGYSPANNGNGYPNSSGAHGVACAGIIGAAHNNKGVAGAAPNVEMFSINIFLGGETGSDLANAITYAKNNGADVLSNSWGYGSCTYSIDALNSALADAKTNGRSGKGCVIVFASGNDYSSCVSYPGNNSNVIAVGAITNTGVRSSYSNQGPKLDIAAPSNGGTMGVYTTDRQGAAGYDSGNYTSTFGGTSAACPLVSGVAALVLSINGNLTSTQVQSLLETTADDMGSSGFDVQFGHGRVNAHQALLAAGGTSGGGGTGGGSGGGGSTPNCVENVVTLTLVTDNYGSETSWTLKDGSGATVQSGSGYGNNQTYTFNWTLADDNYTFTINDSYGDGICCSYGNGSYELSAGATSIKTGGAFGSSETTDFCTSSGGSTGGGSSPCTTIDFANETILSYGGNQDNGTHSIGANGELVISNNAWKAIDYNYTVTANTVIEFDFGSTSQGEIHGIGFDSDNNISKNNTFQVYGSQSWGISNYNDYAASAGSWKTYTIPVGQFYTGSFSKLFFVCDDDASNGGNSYFRNVKIYEGSCGASTAMSPTLFNSVTAVYGTEAEGENNLSVFPNPAKATLNMQLENLEEGTQVQIIDAQGRLVWQSAVQDNLMQIDIQSFAAGVYNLSVIQPDGQLQTKRFVKLRE